jgi:rubrerythrin
MSILIYARIAGVFRDAKDAPTSFEPEEWIEGFQDARSMIAERIALRFKDLPGFNEATFLLACDVAMSDEERAELEHKRSKDLPRVIDLDEPAHVPGLNDALAPKGEDRQCGQCEGTGTTAAMGREEECPVCDGVGVLPA